MKLNINDFPTFEEIRDHEFANNPDIKKEYNRLAPKYRLIEKTLKARAKNKMTQKQVANLMGTKQSALARFEAGDANPTIDFIQRLAKALNTTFVLKFSGSLS